MSKSLLLPCVISRRQQAILFYFLVSYFRLSPPLRHGLCQSTDRLYLPNHPKNQVPPKSPSTNLPTASLEALPKVLPTFTKPANRLHGLVLFGEEH